MQQINYILKIHLPSKNNFYDIFKTENFENVPN